MICERCERIVIMNAFGKGECEECSKEVITGHIPCHKLCLECAEKLNKCQQCGEEIKEKRFCKVCFEEYATESDTICKECRKALDE